MRDERDTHLHSADGNAAPGAEGLREDAAENEELKSLLVRWQVPDAPASLDARLLAAYREQSNRATLGRTVPVEHTSPLSNEQNYEVIKIKRCHTCQEEFADKFSFCPIDGTPLNELAAAIVASAPPSGAATPRAAESQAEVRPVVAGGNEYHLTIIEDAGLTRRLTEELRQAAHESQLTWPEFKRDPFGFIKRSVVAYGTMFWRFISTPNVAIGTATAFMVILTLCLAVVGYDRYRMRQVALADSVRKDIELQEILDTNIPEEEKKVEKGTAGTNKGTGGGSKPKQEKPAGGGGGGREEQKPASFGKLPQASLTVPQVVAPDPNPPKIKNPSLPVPATINADPLLFPPDQRQLNYGDPKSKSTETSSGPGTGNGIGNGKGGGVGPGEGGGVGPGRGGNTGGGDFRAGGGGPGGGGGGDTDYNKTFSPKDVTQKARILSKPEPQYTEEARKNQISGTVVLRAVFSSSGQVTNIRAVSGLPFGLTEKAIAAAHQIRFVPATKDGRAVSQYIQIEYNFNLY